MSKIHINPDKVQLYLAHIEHTLTDKQKRNKNFYKGVTIGMVAILYGMGIEETKAHSLARQCFTE